MVDRVCLGPVLGCTGRRCTQDPCQIRRTRDHSCLSLAGSNREEEGVSDRAAAIGMPPILGLGSDPTSAPYYRAGADHVRCQYVQRSDSAVRPIPGGFAEVLGHREAGRVVLNPGGVAPALAGARRDLWPLPPVRVVWRVPLKMRRLGATHGPACLCVCPRPAARGWRTGFRMPVCGDGSKAQCWMFLAQMLDAGF